MGIHFIEDRLPLMVKNENAYTSTYGLPINADIHPSRIKKTMRVCQ